MLHKHPPSEEEARFHRAVFDVLNNHSLLDHNLGLCISFLKNPKNPEATHSWLSTQSFANKISELAKLLGGSSLDSYNDWADRAASMRIRRNSYAHGIWSYLPPQERAVEFLLPNWILRPDDLPERMTITEVEEMAYEAHNHFKEFMSWRRANNV